MPHRRLRLLITAEDGRSIFTERGELPSLDVELEEERETTSAAAWRALPTIGLAGPLVDCYVDQSGDSADEHVETFAALVELAPPPPGWGPPQGWTPTALAAAPPHVEAGLAGALAERLAELRGDVPVPDLRMPWARPGWYDRAATWITEVLREAGRPAPTAIIQSRHWGISAVMRVDTPGGRLWFKAPFGPFRHEAAVTEFLHRALPQQITPVIAIDEDEGWMLLEHIEGSVVGEDRAPTRAAFECLADVQAGLVDRTADLRAAGCPHRPLGELPDVLRATLATPLMRSALDLSPRRVDQLIDTLTAAIGTVEAVGIPDTFVHGDFHPGNAIATPSGIRLFDWSDAAISHPLVDIATWASWFEDDQDHVDAIYRTFHEVRADRFAHEVGGELARVDRSTVAAVAGAYHTISYSRILEALEPHRRAEHAGGISEFFTLLDTATPP